MSETNDNGEGLELAEEDRRYVKNIFTILVANTLASARKHGLALEDPVTTLDMAYLLHREDDTEITVRSHPRLPSITVGTLHTPDELTAIVGQIGSQPPSPFGRIERYHSAKLPPHDLMHLDSAYNLARHGMINDPTPRVATRPDVLRLRDLIHESDFTTLLPSSMIMRDY